MKEKQKQEGNPKEKITKKSKKEIIKQLLKRKSVRIFGSVLIIYFILIKIGVLPPLGWDIGCFPGKVKTSWTEYHDGRIEIAECSFPLKCGFGDAPKSFCGDFNDRSECYTECPQYGRGGRTFGKPIIYLYPTQKTDIQVRLDYKGKIIADFPTYDKKLKGWNVLAYPDGRIINNADKKEYSYLFWEGVVDNPVDWDLSSGFIVKGSDTREFLQETLAKMGLTPKEYNEFIVYWYPKMKDSTYNLIHFAGKEYTDTAPLTITPKPDSILRVFMVYKPLQESIFLPEQKIESFRRTGFSVIEWGGTELDGKN